MPLAIESYTGVAGLADEPGLLNLSWTSDERGMLDRDILVVLQGVLEDELASGLAAIQTYAVDDPYGDAALRAVVEHFFGQRLEGAAFFAGAGVIALLEALAACATPRGAMVLGDVYPDFPFWIERHGATCTAVSSSRPAAERLASVDAAAPSLIYLERPSLLTPSGIDLDELRSLCDAGGDSVVLIDESNANYLPPEFSAVTLVPEVDRLIVLRGMSKAYGMGGLRVGYAVASAPLGPLLRRTVPPLLASSLSLRLAAALLGLGDVTRALRAAIATTRPLLVEYVKAAGLDPVVDSNPAVPYVFVGGEPEPLGALLERDGVRGKRHLMWSAARQGPLELLRLSIPLHESRVAELRLRTRRHGMAAPPRKP